MQLGLGRRIALGVSMVIGAGTLAACLPGGGQTPPPPWCTPLGIDILEQKLELAERLESDELIALVEHKLDACGATDLGTDGPDGGTDLGDGGDGDDGPSGGTDTGPDCSVFEAQVQHAQEQLAGNPGNPGLAIALAQAQARLAACLAGD